MILAFFCYSNLRRETGGFELASTITLVLQANRLTKCASHPFRCAGHPSTFMEKVFKIINHGEFVGHCLFGKKIFVYASLIQFRNLILTLQEMDSFGGTYLSYCIQIQYSEIIMMIIIKALFLLFKFFYTLLFFWFYLLFIEE